MTIFSDLISNVALLLALSILYSFLTRIWKCNEVTGRILGGLLFGMVAVAGMIHPFNYGPGVIFDARSMVISMAGLFGGPVTAAVSVLIAGSYRIWLGGAGWLTGIGVILTSAALGVIYHYLRRRRPDAIKPLYLFCFGIIVHLSMLLWMLTLPWPLALDVLSKITLPVMLIFPLGTFFLGTLLADQEKRNHTQEALRKSENRYRRIVETANEGIWVIDARFRTTSVNKIMADMLGYEQDEMVGRPITDFMAEDELADQSLRMTKRLRGEPEIYERTYRKKDGTMVWAIVSASPLFDEQGEFVGSFAMLTDISNRKQTEEELDQFFSMSLDMICIADIYKATFTRVNPAFTETLGFTEEELLQKPFLNFIHPDDLDTTQTVIKENLTKGKKVINFQNRYRCKNGGYRWLSWVSHPNIEKGKTYAMARDITVQRQAEEKLRESEERYRSLFTATNDGVCLHEMIYKDNKPVDYRILDINPKYASITGFGRDAAIGALASELYGSGEAPYVETFAKVAETGEPASFETYFAPMDKHLYISVFSPSPSRFATIFQDITDRKRAEAEREQLRNQLTQAQKMEAIGTLAGGIAHDFNNILGIILGNAELAMDDIPEWNPAGKNLEEVRKACLRAKDVVRQILGFSRKSETEKKPFNIASVVKESLKLLRASIPSSIDIRGNVAKDTLDILGDPTQIHQIMMNLCTNAAHAMENEGGILQVDVENVAILENTASRYPDITPGNYVLLRVSDTGDGINPEVIDRIFDPYFTTKDVGKGTGLGLSVVHGIVNGHSGNISVESTPRKGTTFHIVFPAVERTPRAETKKVQELPTGRECILFVDDEEPMVKLNQHRLEKLGYRIIPETDPVEALKFFRKNSDAIDLVITDMTMPLITGDRLAKEMLKIRPDIPIILCTGYSQRISDERALEIGIRKYIEKPVEMEILAGSVREVLDADRCCAQDTPATGGAESPLRNDDIVKSIFSHKKVQGFS